MRIRTVLTVCGMAAAIAAGTTGAAAAAEGPVVTSNGNNSVQSIGNTTTGGIESPEIGLVQGSLNDPCVAAAGHADVGSLFGLPPISAQDLHLLDSPEDQQCAQNSSEIQGDGQLSHILSDDSVLSGNR